MTTAEQQSGGANKKSVWEVNDNTSTWAWLFENMPVELVQPLYDKWFNENLNKTDVWEVTTKPFKEAHFATFPEDLIIDMIKAGTSEHGCCAECGKPYKRKTEPLFDVKHTGQTKSKKYTDRSSANRLSILREAGREKGVEYSNERKTIGWEKTCKCEQTKIEPAVVLDPFNGAGTTSLVSRKLGRNFIAIELNPEYIKIGDKRMNQSLGLFI